MKQEAEALCRLGPKNEALAKKLMHYSDNASKFKRFEKSSEKTTGPEETQEERQRPS